MALSNTATPKYYAEFRDKVRRGEIPVCEEVTMEMNRIDELIAKLRSRYGIVINGLNESRFNDADLETHLAFKENVDAFKTKLRQIGFYTDLSDAYILQKIRPRYKFKA